MSKIKHLLLPPNALYVSKEQCHEQNESRDISLTDTKFSHCKSLNFLLNFMNSEVLNILS